ncbi:hypothetical protein POM88_013737 [Heracleum sosnowskyi]|uniref:Uncharacterized protein n=1 Tax=Heracleum sosnowskyi TaxID=360622 RepID=A0AAD8N3L3_9APIA|nr:hypothetical protein POM88_013737 [Heracleum sosnowskyi]
MGNIDSSFRSLSKDRYEAGVGGLIRDSKEKIIMQFSGPTLACNAFESEVAALGKLVEIIYSSEFSKENFLIFSDNAQLVNLAMSSQVDNDLASYLAEYEAAHWTTMVRIKKPFGRVHEMWNHDMGLGPVLPLFEIVGEDDSVPEVVEPEFDPLMVEVMIDEADAEEVV